MELGCTRVQGTKSEADLPTETLTLALSDKWILPWPDAQGRVLSGAEWPLSYTRLRAGVIHWIGYFPRFLKARISVLTGQLIS